MTPFTQAQSNSLSAISSNNYIKIQTISQFCDNIYNFLVSYYWKLNQFTLLLQIIWGISNKTNCFYSQDESRISWVKYVQRNFHAEEMFRAQPAWLLLKELKWQGQTNFSSLVIYYGDYETCVSNESLAPLINDFLSFATPFLFDLNGKLGN